MHALKDKKIGLPSELLQKIQAVGERLELEQIILFGSRARGTNGDRSDIDLAVKVKDAVEYYEVLDALEDIDTLLIFDVVDMNSSSFSYSLCDEIEKDGVIIFEKI
ncbi:MAG: nucleotidyltransferase domain-containing protein [Eubacterium sp.]|nr:nucleotidyltransferase domain-containing protein [Eubacterium sp.]